MIGTKKLLSEDEKRSIFNIKMSKKESDKMKANAKKFAGGNCSAWIRYACMNFVPTQAELAKEATPVKAVKTKVAKAPAKKKVEAKATKKKVAVKAKAVKPATKVKAKAPVALKKNVATKGKAAKKPLAKKKKEEYSFS